MRMPALALFERALRLESRSLIMCFARIGLLLIILFILLPLQSMGGMGWYGAPGLRFLEQMVWINLVFIILAGLSYFASAITEEKEEMTLGLLRMTDLNPVAILLGKSTSRLIGALLLLLVQVPFILLAVTLGGVGMNQIAAAYGTLLAFMFFVCNFALLLSVIFRNTATAGGFGLVLLFLFFFGHYWVADIEQGLASYFGSYMSKGLWPAVTKTIELWHQAVPLDRLREIFQTGFAGPVFGFQVVSNLVLGIVCFLFAWLLFDACTRHEKDASPTRRWFIGRKSRPSRIPPHLVGPGALTWKDFTFMGGGVAGLLAKFALLAVLIGICDFVAYESKEHITWELQGGLLIWISLLLTAIWLALEASRVFKEEVRWKTLSSLVTLPMSVKEIAYRKTIGALKSTLPLLGATVLGMVMVPDDVAHFLNDVFKEPSAVGALIVAVIQFILFLHLVAFLSLVIKRGALALAFAIQYLGGAFFMGLLSAFFIAVGFGGVMFLIAIGCLVITAILHGAIAHRLERAAAEE